jgi:hypothetical protein
MKSILLALAALFVTGQVSAQNIAPREKVAQAIVNTNLAHGQSISLRKILTNMIQGDYVARLEGSVKANQPGAYLQILIDNQVAWEIEMSTQLGTFTIPLELTNGVDYQSMIVRSVGSTYIESIQAYIGKPGASEPVPHLPNPPPIPNPPGPTPPAPSEPVPHLPNPQPPVNPPANNGSLAGYCDDADHTQFYAAKNFANASTGLNYVKNSASDWALRYNENHACNTIQEFSQRFAAIRNFAVGSDALNMVNEQAVQYALSKVENTTVQQANQMRDTVVYLKTFAISSRGLNLASNVATALAQQWIDRGNCEDINGVHAVTDRFRSEFEFAISSNGLNYDSVRAKDYALSKTRRLSVCGDLFR